MIFHVTKCMKTMQIFLEAIKIDIMENKHVSDDFENKHDIAILKKEPIAEDLSANLDNLTHYDAFKTLEMLEKYVIQNYPHDLSIIYNLKNSFENNRFKWKSTLLDFFKKIN
ncbi:hypothetical protein DMUE_0330 [Dictyocoela muelleri]|nr:hypothetical protein DMUE_0330 [Dictyocoela muelleri]